jgi:hypothetical protein
VYPEPSQPIAFLFFFKSQKKEGIDFCLFYGRFFSTRIITTPTRRIATMMATTAGTKYRSAAVGAGVGIGVAVAAASPTTIAVASCEPQYALEPANVAMTL